MKIVWKRVAARHSREFVKHVLPAVMKPARTLWNEVIGFLFLCLAVMFGSYTVHSYIAYLKAPPDSGPGLLIRLVMAGFCTVIMLWYGISSFRRARRISRS